MDAAKQLAMAGVEVSSQDPRLTLALAEGITAAELVALAKTRKAKGKGIAYLVSTVRGQRADAQAATVETPTAPAPKVETDVEKRLRALDDRLYDIRHQWQTTKTLPEAEARAQIADVQAEIRKLTEAEA